MYLPSQLVRVTVYYNRLRRVMYLPSQLVRACW